MSLSTVTTAPTTFHYSIKMIKDEVRQMVEKGMINRNQPIYTLCQYIPPREWVCVECELERCEYLLRDQVGDLIACENWASD